MIGRAGTAHDRRSGAEEGSGASPGGPVGRGGSNLSPGPRRFPDHADALHLLGILATQAGRPNVAIELIGRAVTVSPTVAEYHLSLGESYKRSGQWDAAIASLPPLGRVEAGRRRVPQHPRCHACPGGPAWGSRCRLPPRHRAQVGPCLGPHEPGQRPECSGAARRGGRRLPAPSRSTPTWPRPIATWAPSCTRRDELTRRSPRTSAPSRFGPIIPRPTPTSAAPCNMRGGSTRRSPPSNAPSRFGPIIPSLITPWATCSRTKDAMRKHWPISARHSSSSPVS